MLMTVFSHPLIETTHIGDRRERKKRREFIYDCAEEEEGTTTTDGGRDFKKNLQAHSSGAKKPKRKCRPSMPCP